MNVLAEALDRLAVTLGLTPGEDGHWSVACVADTHVRRMTEERDKAVAKVAALESEAKAYGYAVNAANKRCLEVEAELKEYQLKEIAAVRGFIRAADDEDITSAVLRCCDERDKAIARAEAAEVQILELDAEVLLAKTGAMSSVIKDSAIRELNKAVGVAMDTAMAKATQLKESQEENKRLRDALECCSAKFRQYALQHREQKKIEKAEANEYMEELCERALAPKEPETFAQLGAQVFNKGD